MALHGKPSSGQNQAARDGERGSEADLDHVHGVVREPVDAALYSRPEIALEEVRCRGGGSDDKRSAPLHLFRQRSFSDLLLLLMMMIIMIMMMACICCSTTRSTSDAAAVPTVAAAIDLGSPHAQQRGSTTANADDGLQLFLNKTSHGLRCLSSYCCSRH
jgi:hypothetical protein